MSSDLVALRARICLLFTELSLHFSHMTNEEVSEAHVATRSRSSLVKLRQLPLAGGVQFDYRAAPSAHIFSFPG